LDIGIAENDHFPTAQPADSAVEIRKDPC